MNLKEQFPMPEGIKNDYNPNLNEGETIICPRCHKRVVVHIVSFGDGNVAYCPDRGCREILLSTGKEKQRTNGQ